MQNARQIKTILDEAEASLFAPEMSDKYLIKNDDSGSSVLYMDRFAIETLSAVEEILAGVAEVFKEDPTPEKIAVAFKEVGDERDRLARWMNEAAGIAHLQISQTTGSGCSADYSTHVEFSRLLMEDYKVIVDHYPSWVSTGSFPNGPAVLMDFEKKVNALLEKAFPFFEIVYWAMFIELALHRLLHSDRGLVGRRLTRYEAYLDRCLNEKEICSYGYALRYVRDSIAALRTRDTGMSRPLGQYIRDHNQDLSCKAGYVGQRTLFYHIIRVFDWQLEGGVQGESDAMFFLGEKDTCERRIPDPKRPIDRPVTDPPKADAVHSMQLLPAPGTRIDRASLERLSNEYVEFRRYESNLVAIQANLQAKLAYVRSIKPRFEA